MKPVGIVVSVLAILAGIVVARIEYDREKAKRPAGSPAVAPGPAMGRAPRGEERPPGSVDEPSMRGSTAVPRVETLRRG